LFGFLSIGLGTNSPKEPRRELAPEGHGIKPSEDGNGTGQMGMEGPSQLPAAMLAGTASNFQSRTH